MPSINLTGPRGESQSVTTLGELQHYVNARGFTVSSGNYSDAVATLSGYSPSTPSSSSGTPVGVTVPRGSLDRYKAARAQAKAGAILGEVVMFGDSTFWGQLTNVTNLTTGDPRYPIPQRLRALAVAAGFPDGGAGIQATTSGSGSSGTLDNLVLEVSKVGTWSSAAGFYGPPRQLAYKNTSNAASDSLTVQMRIPANGGRFRINHTVGTPANAVAWSYSVDGGAATAVAAQTATRKTKTREITGLSAGTHTLTITITTPGVAAGGDEWSFESLGPSGLCFQNYGVQGSKASGRFDIAGGFAPEVFALGYYEDAAQTTPTTPYNVQNVRAGNLRNPVLAVHGLGINDMQNSGSAFASATAANDAAALLQASIGSFAESIRDVCDGLVTIPHLAWCSTNIAYAGRFRAAIYDTAVSYGLPVVDLQVPLGGGYTNRALYGSTLGGPHLNQAGYDAQAQFLWDNVLNAT